MSQNLFIDVFSVPCVSEGRALLVSLHRQVVLHHFNFRQPVYDIKYSPDGRLAEDGGASTANTCTAVVFLGNCICLGGGK